MKLCLAEAIKRVKMLSDKIDSLIGEENSKCETVYRNETEKINYDYDFTTMRKDINDLSDEIIKIKSAINKANNETQIGVNDWTIADALIKMALIKKELQYHLKIMCVKEPKSSKVDIRNDSVIYTELLYDPKECEAYVEAQNELLSKIHLGIDRANLNTYIEI